MSCVVTDGLCVRVLYQRCVYTTAANTNVSARSVSVKNGLCHKEGSTILSRAALSTNAFFAMFCLHSKQQVGASTQAQSVTMS